MRIAHVSLALAALLGGGCGGPSLEGQPFAGRLGQDDSGVGQLDVSFQLGGSPPSCPSIPSSAVLFNGEPLLDDEFLPYTRMA